MCLYTVDVLEEFYLNTLRTLEVASLEVQPAIPGLRRRRQGDHARPRLALAAEGDSFKKKQKAQEWTWVSRQLTAARGGRGTSINGRAAGKQPELLYTTPHPGSQKKPA